MASRMLVTSEPLPDRLTAQGRIANMEADVREAAAVARKRLLETGSKHHVAGWVVDEEGWQMGLIQTQPPTVQVGMRMTRPD